MEFFTGFETLNDVSEYSEKHMGIVHFRNTHTKTQLEHEMRFEQKLLCLWRINQPLSMEHFLKLFVSCQLLACV